MALSAVLGSCVLLAVAGAAPAAPRSPVRVTTAAALIAAIGPNRTIELSAGDYDLGALSHAPTIHVSWEGGHVQPVLIVHDVENLRIVGPSAGTARLYASVSTELEFRNTPGLELKRLAIGCDPGAQSVGEAARLQNLRTAIHDSRDVSIEDVRTLSAGTSPWLIQNVDGARVSRFEDGGRSGIGVIGGRGLRIDGAHVRSPISVNGGAKDGTVAHVTVELDAGADAGIRDAVTVDQESEITLEDVRLVDAVTGKVRRHVNRVRAPARRGYGSVLGEVNVRTLRSGPVGSDPDEPHDPIYAYRLRLADGRETISDLKGSERWGLEPSSVRARRLGNAASPILIAWEDIAQGQGNYQNTYYQVVGPGPDDGVLLQGSRSISGHGGMQFGESGEIAFAFEGGFLTVREQCSRFEMSQEPLPGWAGVVTEHTYFDRRWVSVYESIYRFREGRLEAFRFEEYFRVELESDLAQLARDGYQPVWPHRDGSPPRAGEWLKRLLPIEDDEKTHPRMGSVATD